MKFKSRGLALLSFVLILFITVSCSSSSADLSIDEMYLDDSSSVEMVFDESIPLSESPTISKSLMPSATGVTVYTAKSGNSNVKLDASNMADGYVMLQFSGDKTAKLKVLVTGPSKVQYTYNLKNTGEYEVFPLSDGDGQYTVGVYKNISGTKYSTVYTKKLDIKLSDANAPFLRPNQYVNYSDESEVILLAEKLSKDAKDDLAVIQTMYTYVVNNITYDKEKAATVKSGYLPDVDAILKSKTGICFDYAAVITSMLRSQGIPTKLVVGYTGDIYHAWISTYTEATGWINGIIFFDGTTWKLMDPTFASSSNSSAKIMKYISDTNNYQAKYLY